MPKTLLIPPGRGAPFFSGLVDLAVYGDNAPAEIELAPLASGSQITLALRPDYALDRTGAGDFSHTLQNDLRYVPEPSVSMMAPAGVALAALLRVIRVPEAAVTLLVK